VVECVRCVGYMGRRCRHRCPEVYFCHKDNGGGPVMTSRPRALVSRCSSDLIAAAARQLDSGFDKLTWRLVCAAYIGSTVAIRCGSFLSLSRSPDLVGRFAIAHRLAAARSRGWMPTPAIRDADRLTDRGGKLVRSR